jgi:uncharacterized membrane protein
VADRRTAVKRVPAAPAGVGPKPRLAQRGGTTQNRDVDRRDREEIAEILEDEERPRSERPWRSLACLAAAVVGVGISVYVTILHYAHIKPVCSDTGAINCLHVLTSPQSVFLGIPVPLYGLFFFVAMFVLCVPRLWLTTVWWVPWLRVAVSAVGIVFALRLIYEELFVIRNICLWCTGAHVVAFFMFVVIVTGWEDATRNVIPRRAS